MRLFRKLLQAVQHWPRRRPSARGAMRSAVNVEQLDHRQLLAVNFTGTVMTDIPGPTGPGVVILQDPKLTNPLDTTVRHPGIPPDIAPLIKVSGLDINGIRLQYTPNDDTLSVGIQQPTSQNAPFPNSPVIAGDTDNNRDDGSVNPAVLVKRPAFIDFPSLGGSESMGVFLDLKGNGIPDVVAGISNNAGGTKLYQVAQAVVNPDPALAASTIPDFGTPLPANTGASLLLNDPQHGAFEFQVTNFSKLYQQVTGQPLATASTISVGAFANSNDDDGISEAFFPAQPASFGVIPPVTPPTICPPAAPLVYINPHENNHVNTAHPTLVRVNVFGTSGFDVTQIVPSSVRLGGAAPVDNYFRDINHDGIKDETFVFRGDQINLPAGITAATVTGNLNNGMPANANTFSSTVAIFNRDKTFYSPRAIASQAARAGQAETEFARLLAREEARVPAADRDPATAINPLPIGLRNKPVPPTLSDGTGGVAALSNLTHPFTAPSTVAIARRANVRVASVLPNPTTTELSGPVVSIPRRDRASAKLSGNGRGSRTAG